MKLFSFPRLNSPARLAVATVAALCLSACDDKPADEAKAAEQPAETPAETPAEQPAEKAEQPEEQAAPVSLADSKEALFNQILFTMMQKVTDPNICPDLHSDVKVMLEMLETYYTALCNENGNAAERVRVALMIADTTSHLQAFPKAQAAYERALSDIEATPEDKYARSAAVKGIAYCLMMQDKGNDALARYEEALAIDEELYKAASPAEGEKPANAEEALALAKAATNLLDSYRYLGDCQRFTDDIESAKATYLKGEAVINAVKYRTPEMLISSVRLLVSLGDLLKANGKTQESLTPWIIAYNTGRGIINNNNFPVHIRVSAQRCLNKLVPAIQAAQQELKAAQGENGETTDAAEEDTADIAQTEPLAPLPEATPAPAPEPAAAPAPAPAPVKPQPAKQNNKRRR